MLSRPLLISVAVVLNIFHLFIPARIINYNFDPLLALLSFVTFLTIVFFTSSFKKDLVFIVLILVSFLSQLVSYYQNGGGASDYINLVVLDSNIPDFLITVTILTWWYYRVYKQPKIIPANTELDA
jgi:hypothetical protein